MRSPGWLNLLRAVPAVSKIATEALKAKDGDQEAIEYMRHQAWADGLDAFVYPGAGEIAQRALGHARDAAIDLLAGRDVVDAEYRVLEPTPPWAGFLKRLLVMPYGGHIVLGPVGSGKTTLALKLAKRWHETFGYRVEAVNMYAEDVPAWGVTISKDTLVARMQKLSKYLDAQAVKDEDEDRNDETDEEHERRVLALPPTRRVIIIDEASLGMSSNPNDPARRSAIQALAQCRHLDWVVVYIGQWAGQLPLALLGQTTVWVKRPDGREALTDRDNAVVRDLWERANEAFAGLKSWEWYQEPWLDARSWAYCDCSSLAGKTGYRGLVPFTPPDAETA